MRLTLRTLLAWLDDTLPASEVREIGKQVSESPFAQELVERIHRVTRQRRLTVPSQNGPDGVDANLVAGYMDNELAPEEVAEFEKRCLKSDVHLAEVASVHQILSMIGHKAKVPGEARWRMYRLIKGPEVAVKPASERPAQPVAELPPTWGRDDYVRSPAWEKYGPAAAVLALVGVLGLSAWQIVGPASQEELAQAKNRPANPAPPGPGPIGANRPGPALLPNPNEGAVAPAEELVADNGAMPAEATEPAPAVDVDVPAPAAPRGDGTLALGEGSTGQLFRRNAPGADWELVARGSPPKAGQLLLNLDPWRTNLRLGKARLEMIGETSLSIPEAPGNAPSTLMLHTGRVRIRDLGDDTPLTVTLDRAGIIRAVPVRSTSGALAIERLPARGASANAILRIYADEGQVVLGGSPDEQTIVAPGSLDVLFPAQDPTDPAKTRPLQVGNAKSAAVPDWVTAPRPTPLENQLAENFTKAYRPNLEPVTAMSEIATSGDSPKIRELALSGLGALGELDIVLMSLGTQGNRNDRLAAIRVLRQVLDRGPEGLAELRDDLQRVGGRDAEWPTTVEKLLLGYTLEEAQDPAVFARLVRLLTHSDVTVRELAIDNLMALTRRDELGYDPDSPQGQGKGLEEWQALQKAKKLKATK